jgi:hypothetical protein
MAKYKSYDYAQAVMVAVSLEEQLEPGSLEYTIHYVVEERLDLSDFDQQRSNDQTGRPGYDPRVLLKVVLLGYAPGQAEFAQAGSGLQKQYPFHGADVRAEARSQYDRGVRFGDGRGTDCIAVQPGAAGL